MCIMEMTERRRGEIRAILGRLGPGVDRSVKIEALRREMLCKPSYRQACSLLGQMSKKTPKRKAVMRGRYRRPTDEERFKAMQASLPASAR